MKIARATPLSRWPAVRGVVLPARQKQLRSWMPPFLSALMMTACVSADDPEAPISPRTASVRLIEPDEFADAILEPNRVTINVHVPFEGDIAGTEFVRLIRSARCTIGSSAGRPANGPSGLLPLRPHERDCSQRSK